MNLINFLFNDYLYKLKSDVEILKKNNIDDIDTKYRDKAFDTLCKASNYFDSIDVQMFSDFSIFNNFIQKINEELNSYRKDSIEVSSLALVVEDVDSYSYTPVNYIKAFNYSFFSKISQDKIDDLILLTKLLAFDSSDFYYLNKRGDLYLSIGLTQEAILDYQKSLELNYDKDLELKINELVSK